MCSGWARSSASASVEIALKWLAIAMLAAYWFSC
jgi:hypothetical protein